VSEHASTAITCSECGEDCGHRTVEIETLRAALQAIVDFQPDREELGEEFGAEVAACEQCEVWRRKQHPSQRMCETHVRRTFAVRDSNAQSAAYQHYTLRDIARRALDSGSEARMALRYEVPPATPELRAAIDRLSDPRENGRNRDAG